MRGVRRGEAGGPLHGRLTSAEEDLLRAALVFTGAGLDATLKRLIRDTLPALLESNEQAHRKFEDFAVKQLGGAEAVDGKVLARYIVASNPRERLIEDYIYDLTGSSLQSAEQVDLTAGALGINDGPLRAEINGLRDLFVARNQVSHELDLQAIEQSWDRTRRSRAMGPTTTLCERGFMVAQQIVNAVGELLTP